jgi:WD40 repeat protein
VCWSTASKAIEYILKVPVEVTSVTHISAIGKNSLVFLSDCGILYILNLKKRLITLHIRERAFTSFEVNQNGQLLACVGVDGTLYLYDLKMAVAYQKRYATERIELGIEEDLLLTELSEASTLNTPGRGILPSTPLPIQLENISLMSNTSVAAP